MICDTLKMSVYNYLCTIHRYLLNNNNTMSGVAVNQYKKNNVYFDQCYTPVESDFKCGTNEQKNINSQYYILFKF